MNRLRSAAPGQLSLPGLLEESATSDLPVASSSGGGCGRLDEWDRAVLRFAAEHPLSGRYVGTGRVRTPGAAAPARRQALSDVLDHPQALDAYPEFVGRLRALRDRRRRLRELPRTTAAAPGSGGERR